MRLGSRKGASSRIVGAAALVMVILVSLLAAFEYVQASKPKVQSKTPTSSVSELQSEDQNSSSLASGLEGANLTAVTQTFLSHVLKLDGSNESAILSDYAPNATVVWSGSTYGMGGTYTGTQNIKHLYQVMEGDFQNTTFTAESYEAGYASNGTPGVQAHLAFVGHSPILGTFKGTISASYQYVHGDGTWLISQEDWDFEAFNI